VAAGNIIQSGYPRVGHYDSEASTGSQIPV